MLDIQSFWRCSLILQRDILSLFRVGRARAQRSGARNRNRERSGRVSAVSITSTITSTSTNGHRLLQNKELPWSEPGRSFAVDTGQDTCSIASCLRRAEETEF